MKKLLDALGAVSKGRLDQHLRWTHGHVPNLIAALRDFSTRPNFRIYFTFYEWDRRLTSLDVEGKYIGKDHNYGSFRCLGINYLPQKMLDIDQNFSIISCLRGKEVEIFVSSGPGHISPPAYVAYNELEKEAVAYFKSVDKNFSISHLGWQPWANFFYKEINNDNFDVYLRVHNGSWHNIIGSLGDDLVMATKENLAIAKKLMRNGGTINKIDGCLYWSQ